MLKLVGHFLQFFIVLTSDCPVFDERVNYAQFYDKVKLITATDDDFVFFTRESNHVIPGLTLGYRHFNDFVLDNYCQSLSHH